jgi:PAS domain S-box-containing protein
MKNKTTTSEKDILRQKAEEFLKNKSVIVEKNAPDIDIIRLVHELEVHQIELEMQNEELHLAKIKAEAEAEKYTNLYDFAPSGYFTLSKKGEIMELNFRGANLLGKERSLLLKKRFGLFVSDETRPTFNLFLEEIFDSKTKQTCEIALTNDSIFVHLSGIVSDDEALCLVTMHDISQRKKAEEETKVSEEKYHNLFETNRDSITLFRIDTEGYPSNFIEVNQASTKLFGYTKKELLELNICNLETLSDTKVKVRLANLISHGKIDYETIIKTKKGKNRNVEIESLLINYLNKPAVMNITRDITERKQNEENARKAQENLATILVAIPDLLFEVDLEGLIYYYQGNRNDLLVAPPSEFMGKKFQDIIPADAANVCFEAMQEAKEKGWSIGKQYSLDLSPGKCWFELSVSPINESGNTEQHFIMLARDITDRKKAEKSLQENKENLQSIFDSVTEAIYIMDETGTFIDVNKGAEDMYQYSRQELIGKTPQLVAAPGLNDLDEVNKISQSVFETGIPISFEFWAVRKNGEIFPKEVVANKGKYFGKDVLIITARDITDRKKAESDLQKSQEKLQGIFNVANSGIVLIDKSGHFLLFNDWCSKLLGYTREEFQELNLSAISHSDDLEKSRILNTKIIEGKINNYLIEKRYIRKDKSFVWCEVSASAIKDQENNVVNIVGIINDITERKKAKMALQESESRLIEAQSIAKVGNWETDLSFTDVNWSKETGKILGIKKKASQFQLEDFLGIVHPDDRLIVQKTFVHSIKNHSINSFEHRIKTPEGIEKVVEQRWKILHDDQGQPIRVIGSCHDITERKLNEEKLFANERFLNQTQTIANLGSYTLDFATGKWTSTTILNHIFGIDTSFEKTAEGWQKIMHPDWREVMNDYFNNEVIAKKANFNKEYKIIKVDSKEERWLHGMGEIIFDNEGQPVQLIGSIQDITERKLAEEKLMANEKFLNQTQTIANLGSYSLDFTVGKWTSTTVLDQIFGIDTGFDRTVEGWVSIIHPEWQTIMNDYLNNEVIAQKKDFNKDYKIVKINSKKERWVHGMGEITFNEKGQPLILIGSIQDITERKLAEEAVIVREQNYRTLFDTSTDSIFIHDINSGVILDVNETMLKTFGYSKKEIIGNTIGKLSLNTGPYSEKAALNYFQKAINEGKQVFEWMSRRKDGSTFWMEMMLKPITIDGKERILAVGRDITLRKLNAEKLKVTSEKFQDLVNSTGGIVWEADAQTFNFNYVSKQAERLLGFSVEEWYAEGFWANHLHPEDKDKAIAYCISQTKKMVAHDFTYRFICKKGKIIWLRDIVNVVSEDGKPRWLRGVMFDITNLKENENSLRESEEKYRGLIENSPDGIVLYSEDKIAFINDEGIRMVGAKNKEEIIGKSVLEFVHPDSLESIIQRMTEVTKDKRASEIIEEKFIDINGAPFDVEIKAIPTLYEHKPAVQVIVHDITQRKRAAQELNKINRVYALISQINNLIIRTHNQEELFQEICNIAVNFGKFRMSWIGLLNDNHKIITGAFAGYEKGYFTKSNITTISDEPEGRGPTGIALREGKTVICKDIANDPMMKPWRKDALERGYFSSISIPLIVRNKKIGVFNLYSEETNFFSSEEEISLLEKIVLNIAFALETILIEEDRKRTEEKIRQLSQAVEQSPVTIVITNTKGEIEYVNSKFVETTGFTAEEVLGKNPRILKSGYTSTNEYKELWQTVATGKEWHGEFHNKRKDGTLFWESATISPILNAEGNSTHFIAIKEDITQRKKVEKELLKSKERAEESDRLKLAFLANMSHEIRTPMNGILGFTELLKEPKLTGEEQREYINIIEKSGKRMLNIINDIISISKVESGQVDILLSETNVNEQIEYLQTFFKPEAKQKGIQLHISKQLPFKEAVIKTDREKLYAILTNLIKNAIKFTNEGTIEFGCEKKGENLEFFVKDTGLGISKSQKKIIFERFRQANETISRSHEGSGLGLAISKAYVEKLGGKIWVESKEGKGSAFYFTIPFCTESKAELEEKVVAEKVVSEIKQENKIKDLKVLIVEDDAISKLLITIAAKPFSKEILKVSTGIEAIEACRNNPDINLVMMDINMPEMGGYEATKQIREFNKDLVIIAQTANGMQSDREEAIAAGCTDYISKPINIIDLGVLIQKYFNK